jgi:ribose/xylose/arabinose/galactoside ABC-type transport system permease subunit
MGVFAMIAGTFVSILAGAVCGFANGMLVTKLKLAPFIVTLGTMSISAASPIS